jgi:hypothetical protein
MPFGIIDVTSDIPLAGTELLVREERSDAPSTDEDTSRLQRVMYKVWHTSRLGVVGLRANLKRCFRE